MYQLWPCDDNGDNDELWILAQYNDNDAYFDDNDGFDDAGGFDDNDDYYFDEFFSRDQDLCISAAQEDDHHCRFILNV